MTTEASGPTEANPTQPGPSCGQDPPIRLDPVDVFFLACECPWVDVPKGLTRLWTLGDPQLVHRLRVGWSKLRTRSKGNQKAMYCLDTAAQYARDRDFVSAAGWMQACVIVLDGRTP